MIIRLLQVFDEFELDLNAQPLEGHAPKVWKEASGRQAQEQLFPKSHLTMYFHVSLFYSSLWEIVTHISHRKDYGSACTKLLIDALS